MGSSADRAAVLVQAIEASVTGDSRVVRELYADDELEDRQEAFSDIDLDVTALDVGADQACVECIATATHSGPLVIDEDVVIEPTGGRFTLRGVTIADFEGDRIRAFRQYWDEVSLLEQLELVPTE